ncbi:MAG TPA: hypothetical protein PLE19_05105 [Planctomycetota bacterium]|nr:hypothetical protein [Planctomycetota bacterium]HRR79847.1 hypothetical protein [Planctomycetota bacterium]HRT92923.1 hypothetical protein [Planctomycetota bacterium]
MKSILAPLSLAILGLAAACWAGEGVQVKPAGAEVTVARGPLTLVFDAGGNGFVAGAQWANAVACVPSPAGGLFASIAVPAGETPPLQPIRGKEIRGTVKVARVAGKQAGGAGEVEIAGTVAFEGLGEAPFTVRIAVPESGPAMAVSAELALPEKAKGGWLTSFGLALPLSLTFHPNSDGKSPVDRKTVAVAILPRVGVEIPEVRWLVAEQNDKSVWGHMLWQLAGIRQATPASCQVWEAWSKVNPPFVLQHGGVHPGWMAVADGRLAIAAGMPGIEKAAPKEIYLDSQAKALYLCFQSPYCRPLDLSSAPATLAAGPAYIWIEPSEEETRNAQAYRDAKKRPALAAIGEALAKLPPTQANFGAMKVADRVGRSEPIEVPDDPAFASHDPGPPDEVTLWVDEPNGANHDALPVTRGIPLRRGALKDAAKVALLDERSQPIPCVAKPTAFWPDGSLKWLALDFQPRLEARKVAKLKLVLGGRAQPAPISNPLKVTEAPASVSVDTGRLRFAAANAGGKLALTIGLDLNGDGKVTDDETIVKPGPDIFGCAFSHIQDTETYRSRTWCDPGEADPGVAEVTELKVEEQSPLRAVVLVRANLKHQLLASTIDPKHRPQVGTPVSLRFHLYAGSATVRLQHTFMFAGDVTRDFLRQLGVRLPLPAEPRQTVTASVDRRKGLEWPREGESGVLQEGADSALLWQAAGPKVRELERGCEATGWLDVTGTRWGVAVGLRRMREMWPQEIHVDKEGVWTHFYSPHVPPMDVRRYSFHYGDGESSSTGWGTAFGALRTHEAVWAFHAAGPGPQQDGLSRAGAVLRPPLARVSPRYVADTLAVGHVAEHGAATNDAHYDNVLYHLPRMHRHNRDYWRWFGFWDFGDEIQVYDAYRHRWAVDDGRYGWYNNEPVRDLNHHLAYLMTGSRRIWEAAEAMSYHVFEVDVRHANPQPFMSPNGKLGEQKYRNSTTSGIDLCGGRHNCQHWSDGYWGQRLGSPPGFRLAYYQTADPVLREYMERIVAAAMKTRRSQYMAADGDEAVLWAMIMGHEMTLDPKYLDRINGYVNLQIAFAKEHNGYPAAKANWDWATNTAGAPPEDPNTGLWIWSFGGSIAFIEIADLYQNRALDKMINEWTLALEGFGPDAKRREDWSNHMAACPLLAHYYRTTGDKRALEWLAKRAKGFHGNIPKDAPTTDLPADAMETTFPAYTPHDGYGWVYTTTTFWYVGIPAWQGALRVQAAK